MSYAGLFRPPIRPGSCSPSAYLVAASHRWHSQKPSDGANTPPDQTRRRFAPPIHRIILTTEETNMTTTRTARAHWEGSLMEGAGQVALESSGVGTFDEIGRAHV